MTAASGTARIKFNGGSGFDRFIGGYNNEEFQGGPDNDEAWGGPGDDTLISGWLDSGQAIATKGDGLATFDGQDGNDVIVGGPFGDVLRGRNGQDSINGGGGSDNIWGGNGNDWIDGGDGRDTIYGENHDDVIDGGGGDDTIDGGDGDDVIGTGPSGAEALLDVVTENESFYEVVYGGFGADSIIASYATGQTYIDAGPGSDTVSGSTSVDIVHGGPGQDWLFANGGADRIHGDGDDDRIEGSGAWDFLYGDDDNDDIWGGGGPDTTEGGGGDDVISSGPRNGAPDQPWDPGDDPNGSWPAMAGAGGPGCDEVDGHSDNPPDGCVRRPSLQDGMAYVNPGETLFATAYGDHPNWAATLAPGPTFGHVADFTATGAITYVPPTVPAVDTLTYWINDGQQDSNAATYTIKVVGFDTAPPAKSFTAPKPGGGTPMNVPAPGVLQGMAPFDKATLVGGQPEHGTLALAEDGSFTYTPEAGFVGTDSFAFQASNAADPDDHSDVLRVDIEVPDYATRGFEDGYDSAPGTSVSDAAPGVLWNDDWADTAVLVAAGPVSQGSLNLSADGSFVFQPAAGFSGDYSFTYKAKDSVTLHESEPTTVTIYVSPINAQPETYSMASTASELNVPSPGVLGNDTGANQAELIEDDGPAFGTVTLNDNGSFTYVPNAGFIGTDFFDYYAINTTTGARSIPTTVTINVGPHAADDDYFVAMNGTLNIDAHGVLTNDIQADHAELTEDGGPQHAASFTLNSNGSFTYIPVNGYSGDDSFVYVAIDGTSNQSAPAIVTIHVVRPTALDDEYIADSTAGVLYVGAPGVLANDTAADISVSVTGSGPAHGTLSYLLPDGTFSYVSEVGFQGDDSFAYVARNNMTSVESEPATVTIHVIGGVADEFDARPWGSLEMVSPGVLSNDNPWLDSASQQVNSGYVGYVELHADGSFIYRPPFGGYVGDDSFRYIACNSATGWCTSPVTVTIHVFYVPELVDDEYSVQPNHTLYVLSTEGVLLNDPVSLSTGQGAYVFSGPSHGSLLYFGSLGDFSYTPDEGFEGDDTFEYYVDFGNGHYTLPAIVTIHVTAI